MDIDGDADICTHVLKLSEETCREPEHVVFEVLVVIVVVSIASENVTVMLSVIDTELWLSAVVETEDTVGDVVSVVVVLSVVPVAVYSSFSSLQEKTVRLKQKIRKTNITFFIFSSIPKLKSYWLVY